MAAQWLRLHASDAGGLGSIPGQGTKTPHATRCSQKYIYSISIQQTIIQQ